MQLAPNDLLQGRYRIQALIAQGGMGAVYRAVDERLGNTVALKQTLMNDPQLRAAFEREARLLASLHHPTLPVVSDHFAEGAGQFLVMQYIPGDDLAALLAARGGPFPLAEALPWADRLLDALDYLHTQRPPVIHRDLKPQNLKLTPRGEIILLDFGLAKGELGGGKTSGAPSLFGYTPQYAPIEQIQGSGTEPRSDLYAFGATFYQLLTGEVPPDALTRATALVVGNPDPLVPAHQRNPQLPSALGDLLQQTMAQAAAQRPASAVALRQALAQAVQPPPTTSSGTQTRQQLSSAGQPTIVMARQDGAPSLVAQSASRSTLQRRLALIGGLALLVLVLATFALLRLLGGDQDSALQVATGGRAPTVVLTATTPVAATPAPGADRSHPLPSSATAQSTSWAVLVTGVTRGDAAWNLLYETNAMADPPPEGQEYLIVHLRARALVGSDARRTLYPELTGDRLVAYRPVAAVTPHERPDEYAVGSEYDIDFPYLVETAESNLIFALDDLGVTGDAPVFIALDEGAKITVDPGLVAIKPTNVGADPREPAQLGEMVTTEDFQVAIHQVVRGDTAYQRLLKANQFNDPPREGYEYLLFLAEVRSISPKDETVMVSGTDFYSVDADADDLEASAITFTSVVEPEPAPPFYLYPGGRATGWVTVEIRKDAPNARIAFGPGMSLNDLNTRYFAIK